MCLKKVFVFLVGLVCLLNGLVRGEAAAGGVTVGEKDLTPGICRLMLQDDEPAEVLYDEEERSFQVNRPLQVRINKKRELRLRFYSPRAIGPLTVWVRFPGYKEQFKLAEFERIPGFANFRIALPFQKSGNRYRSRSGKEIVVAVGRHWEELNLEVECDDPYYRKLVGSRCTWKVSFGAYRGKNWTPLLPVHAREAVAVALNLAYLFSTDEFRERLLTYRGRLFRDNGGTEIDIELLYKHIFCLPALVYGRVTGVNGLGGGSVFGLAEWCYFSHYADDDSITHTIFHEFAHCLGYTHTGNMTYENGLGRGWVSICGELYREMSVGKRLPVYSRCFLNSHERQNEYTCDRN